MTTFWQDVRYGLRMLAKDRGFTTIAILTLALGIGANTAIFSLLNQVLLRRLPVKNPSELVVLRAPGPTTGHISSDGDPAQSFAYPMYKGLRDTNKVFSGMIAHYEFRASLASRGQTERGLGELVSGNYFEVLGVRPALGRVFSLDDDRVPGAQPVVVLSHAYWLRQFGGNADILNKSLLINNTELTVVGVAQSGFAGIQVGKSPDVFVPMMMKAQMTPGWNGLDNWNDAWLAVLARRKPEISIEQAAGGINIAYHPLLEQQLQTIKGWDEKKRQRFLDKKVFLSSGAQGRTTLQSDSGTALIALFVMVALVLLLSCTNLANLLLARGMARQREFAIRAAMGASRERMIRQLLVESGLCAVAGGALGLVIGAWTLGALISRVTEEGGVQGLSASLDQSVLLFAAGVTLLCGLLFGLIPAWRVTRSSVTDSLKEQSSTFSAGLSNVRLRKTLVAGQVAFTLLLLGGACFFSQTLWNLRKENLGLKPENVITFSIQPDLNGYDAPRAIALVDQVHERIRALPAVHSAGSSDTPTLTGDDNGSNITAEAGAVLSEDDQHVNYEAVSAGYFSTLGIPLLSGREFRASDAAMSPKVAVVSEKMAKRFWPGRDPVGLHFAFGGGSKVKPDIEIVGVVKDVKQDHVRSEFRPYVYVPYAQRTKLQAMTFYVRTAQDPMLLAPSLRQIVGQIDANLPVFQVMEFERVVDQDLLGERMVAGLSVSFGVLASLLAGMGIYGVLSYVVGQRTREIGVRMALGAVPSHIRLLVAQEVGLMIATGIGVGLPLTYGLARLGESLLYGVSARDPLVYLLGLTLVVLVALVACYVPTRRATRVDPIVALRYE